jgi:hypothetical protein
MKTKKERSGIAATARAAIVVAVVAVVVVAASAVILLKLGGGEVAPTGTPTGTTTTPPFTMGNVPLSGSEPLWRPVIDLNPAEPAVGDEVRVNVCLLWLGPGGPLFDPSELRANYTASLKITDSRTESVYISREFTNEPPGDRRYMSIRENQEVGLGDVGFVFTMDGEYVAEASVASPNLSVGTAQRAINVGPGTIEEKYEAENRVGDWVLDVRVTPTDITVDDNIAVEATMKYTGSDNFRVFASQPFINQLRVMSVDGTDFWGTAIPSVTGEVEVYPQLSQGFRFVAGPNAANVGGPNVVGESHIFVPGMYRVEVSAVGCNPDGSQVGITVVLFIEVKPAFVSIIWPQPGEYLTYGENKSKILLVDSGVVYCTIEFDSPPYGAHVGDPGIVVGGTIKNEYDKDYWICLRAVAFNSEGEEIGHSIDLGSFVGIIALHVGSGQTGNFGLHLKYREDIERIEFFVGSVSEIPPP